MTALELEQLIASGTKVLQLPLAGPWIVSVRAHLEVALFFGAQLLEFDLEDDAESAPVFRLPVLPPLCP